jgi:glycosyltransferase involved in cell wall biosynthesis
MTINIKLGIIGTRGIPAKYGGFETFAQELSPLMVKNGFHVTVYCDQSESTLPPKNFKDVSLFYISTTKTNNPLLYYLLSVWHSLKREDVILVAGTGGSLFYVINIFFRKKIITNVDGVESERDKWSSFKKAFIKLTEIVAVNHSTHIIADSKGITNYLHLTYPNLDKAKLSTIEYGAFINNAFDQTILDKYGLKKGDYYLVVSRLEPENNIKMIIDGYKLSHSSKPLIIVGDFVSADYAALIQKEKNEKIRLLGGIYNPEELAVIRYSAFAYIHGHSVGGTNPSLLEALGSGNIAICHDNPFNREVTDNKQLYFSQPSDLKKRLEDLEQFNEADILKLQSDATARIANYYTWGNIANKYTALLLNL